MMKKHDVNSVISNKLLDFFITRLFHWYEEMGYSVKIIKSVLSYKSTLLIDVHKK